MKPLNHSLCNDIPATATEVFNKGNLKISIVKNEHGTSEVYITDLRSNSTVRVNSFHVQTEPLKEHEQFYIGNTDKGIPLFDCPISNFHWGYLFGHNCKANGIPFLECMKQARQKLLDANMQADLANEFSRVKRGFFDSVYI